MAAGQFCCRRHGQLKSSQGKDVETRPVLYLYLAYLFDYWTQYRADDGDIVYRSLGCGSVIVGGMLGMGQSVYRISVGLARTVYHTVYDRIFGGFPAKNTVYTPYIYGSGQPYVYRISVMP